MLALREILRGCHDLSGPGTGAPSGSPCAECGAPLATDQAYCVQCGARRGPLPARIAVALVGHRGPRASDRARGDSCRTTNSHPEDEPENIVSAARAGVIGLLVMLAFGVRDRRRVLLRWSRCPRQHDRCRGPAGRPAGRAGRHHASPGRRAAAAVRGQPQHFGGGGGGWRRRWRRRRRRPRRDDRPREPRPGAGDRHRQPERVDEPWHRDHPPGDAAVDRPRVADRPRPAGLSAGLGDERRPSVSGNAAQVRGSSSPITTRSRPRRWPTRSRCSQAKGPTQQTAANCPRTHTSTPARSANSSRCSATAASTRRRPRRCPSSSSPTA